MVKALVSNIQRYSTKDGPGIRSTLFLTGCTLRCKWCSNPELLEDRQVVLHFRARCHKCGQCIVKDPSIKMMDDGAAAEKSEHKKELLTICPFDAFEFNSRYMDSKEAVEKLLKDQVYYEVSGGGVTISGGEALIHPEFDIEILKELKDHGIHTCIDTAGNVPLESLKAVLPYTDLILFDLKAYDSVIHKKCTGFGNERILQNFRYLCDINFPMWIRMPVVAGYNDDDEDFRKRLKLTKGIDSIKQIDVLCYHEYGMGKYKALGMEYEVKDGFISEEKADRLLAIAAEENIKINLIRE